jgi:serine/threonine-protein kinase
MSTDDRTRILPGRTETGVGTQLSGIYELDERIASGGMGEVYRGHNIQTGDLVAIKIVLPEFARDQTILSLFRKEASILNHLSHEAVVRYHVFTVDPAIGRPYLAMEYVDGQSLFDVMREGPMAPGDVCRLCHRLASGLSAVHRAGAIHRDLSPDNVILPDGRVERAKIIDFGIARSAHVGGETLIGGRFAGKYNYVSPEQLGLYGGEVSERSDIYSLGLILAAALRGRPLDMTGSQVDVVEKRRVVPNLTGIDGKMRPIVEAMLQPDPDRRPASMAEIVRMARAAADADEEWDEETLAARPWTGLGRRNAVESGNAGGDDPAPFVEHVRPAYLSRPKPARAKPPAQSARRKGGSGAAVGVLLLLLAAAAGAGAYFGGYLPWSVLPNASGQKQAALVPERSPEQAKTASAEPAAKESSKPTPVLPPHEEPATLPPVQAHPAQPAPEQAQPAQIQPEQTKPATSKPEQPQPEQPQPKSAAVEAKTDHAAPMPGLPASEIIKRFLDQAGKNSTGNEPAKDKADANAPAQAKPPPTGPSKEPAETPRVQPPEGMASAAPPQADTKPATSQAAAPPRSNGSATPQPDVQAAIGSQLPGWTKLQPPSGKAPEEAPAETAKNPASVYAPATASADNAPISERRLAELNKLLEETVRRKHTAQNTSPASTSQPSVAPPEAKASSPAPAPTPATEPERATPPSRAEPPKLAADTGPAPKAPAPAAEEPNKAAAVPASPSGAAKHPVEQPDASTKASETIAMNVPRPSVPPSPATPFEKASLWLRDFSGGDCFYAAPDSSDGTAFGIVGFGTTPDPFVKLMKAFNAEFGSEPDIQVRLISPAQCALTRFMRGFDPPAGNLQTLTLDRTSVANGSPISGVLATEGGLRSNLLLIDHDGMTYNIDRLLIVDGDKAKFSARISLDPASRAKGKPMPEIVLAITGAVDIRSASTLQAAPASEVLPKIRDEIRRSGAAFSATAKYFQLGG